MSVTIRQWKRRNISEDLDPHQPLCFNLLFRILVLVCSHVNVSREISLRRLVTAAEAPLFGSG